MSGPGLIGKAIRIKGELHGEEDLIIEGKVEGLITLEKHLIIESTGVVNADMKVENITVKGQVKGNTIAQEKVEVTSEALVVGDIKAPRLVIQDGARIKGAVDMDVKLPEGV